MFTNIAKGAIFIYCKNSSFCLEALALAIFSKISLICECVKDKFSYFCNGITKIVFFELNTLFGTVSTLNNSKPFLV